MSNKEKIEVVNLFEEIRGWARKKFGRSGRSASKKNEGRNAERDRLRNRDLRREIYEGANPMGIATRRAEPARARPLAQARLDCRRRALHGRLDEEFDALCKLYACMRVKEHEHTHTSDSRHGAPNYSGAKGAVPVQVDVHELVQLDEWQFP